MTVFVIIGNSVVQHNSAVHLLSERYPHSPYHDSPMFTHPNNINYLHQKHSLFIMPERNDNSPPTTSDLSNVNRYSPVDAYSVPVTQFDQRVHHLALNDPRVTSNMNCESPRKDVHNYTASVGENLSETLLTPPAGYSVSGLMNYPKEGVSSLKESNSCIGHSSKNEHRLSNEAISLTNNMKFRKQDSNDINSFKNGINIAASLAPTAMTVPDKLVSPATNQHDTTVSSMISFDLLTHEYNANAHRTKSTTQSMSSELKQEVKVAQVLSKDVAPSYVKRKHLEISEDELKQKKNQQRLAMNARKRKERQRNLQNEMFKCFDCGKCFQQANHLKHHAMIHTGMKPYQ